LRSKLPPSSERKILKMAMRVLLVVGLISAGALNFTGFIF